MNSKNIMHALSGISHYMIEEAENYKPKQKINIWVKCGTIAAAVIVLLVVVPIVSEIFKDDSPLSSLGCYEPLENTISRQDLIVFAKYKKNISHANSTEYIFEITETIFGETDSNEISVFSKKENLFSKDDMAKVLKEWKCEYKKNTEYLLALRYDSDTNSKDTLVWGFNIYVETMNLESAKSNGGFLTSTGLSVESSREDLKHYLIDIMRDNN